MINPCCSEFRVGTLYAYGGSRKRKDILLSVYIDPKFQKSGYGVYAIAAYVKHLFNERNVEMVLFDVYDHNCSVVKILQRAGATRTSLVRRSTSGNESREVHRFAFTDGQVAQLSRFL